MINFYDVHSHIDDKIYDNEINEYLNFLLEKNIHTNIVGCDLESSIKALSISKKSPENIKTIVGIHPNNIKFIENENIIKDLEKLIINNRDNIVSIGEIGLDLFYEKKYLKEQLYYCEKQIELSIKYDLPIMFHIRNAFEEIKSLMMKYKKNKKVIHCFSTNWDEAKFYLENNCYISIPGIVTFSNATLLKSAVKNIPIEKILCETDSPYLTPKPFRGKINYPHYVQYVYEEIAKIKSMNVNEVKKIINNNALNFFKIARK